MLNSNALEIKKYYLNEIDIFINKEKDKVDEYNKKY